MEEQPTSLNSNLESPIESEFKSDPTWKEISLGAVVDSLKAGVSVNSDDRKAGANEVGILKTSAVTYGTFLADAHKAVLAGERGRCAVSPKKNCIIISRMNTQELVGANAYVNQDYPNLFLPDRLWQLEVKRDGSVCPLWLSFILSSPKYRQMISDSASGTSGSMKNISKPSLLALPISPPLSPNNARSLKFCRVGMRGFRSKSH